MSAELTVIMVNYNTRDLTLKALETLFENTPDVSMNVILWDNASTDGSVEAIAEQFQNVDLIVCPDNVGFARANNMAAERAATPWLLLLNPDTETFPGAIRNLLDFAKAHPEAGIVGGRTLFPDGSLNIASCWNKMTVWSLFCRAAGLTRLFPRSAFFNPEAIGGWQRDSVREVDIVVGCFLMIALDTWRSLGGFREKYFMFGEEVDLCLRAANSGLSPMITPNAEIIHHVGGSYSASEERMIKVLKGRVTIIQDHWGRLTRPLGLILILAWVAGQNVTRHLARVVRQSSRQEAHVWDAVWRRRSEWLAGY